MSLASLAMLRVRHLLSPCVMKCSWTLPILVRLHLSREEWSGIWLILVDTD
jgi:hypothetical protein